MKKLPLKVSMESLLQLFAFLYSRKILAVFQKVGGCSIVGKPLCYHANRPYSISHGGHTNRSPYPLVLLGQLSLLSFRGR